MVIEQFYEEYGPHSNSGKGEAVMKTTEALIPYGYRELHRLHQRYMMLAMLFAASIQMALIGGYRMSEWLASADDIGSATHLPKIKYTNIPLPPSIFEGLTGVPKAAIPVKAEYARPVPVKDNLADTSKTIGLQNTPSFLPDPNSLATTNGMVNIEPPPGETTVEMRFVEKLPVVVINPPPVYPELALRAGMEGRVVINVLLDKEGKVKQAVMMKRSDEIFVEPALDAARKWIFTPAIMNDHPVQVWVAIPFHFKLIRNAK
jgi:TonB family protein